MNVSANQAREEKRIVVFLGFFFQFQGRFLITCYILSPGPYLGNEATIKHNKMYHFSYQREPFSLLQVFLSKKGTQKMDAYFV